VNGVAFVGAGKMVSAIVKSLLHTSSFKPSDLVCCSARDGTSERLAEETGIQRSNSLLEMLDSSPEVLVLGCKPQQLAELPSEVSDKTAGIIVLSIMAGITLERLREAFPKARNIVRSMPNTPGQIGEGVTGYLFAQGPSSGDAQLVNKVLSSLGEACLVEFEDDIDRVTAISGSGPAYLFEFACALEKAAEDIGLSPDLAEKLSRQTIVGAAKLIEQSGLHPEELRNQVTSPNGTTQAALESFSSSQLREIVIKAANAARERSIELSRT
tara:strand:- start:117 stop:926 length:810 start_codon:yes stop_codon:yes gene_type:complete